MLDTSTFVQCTCESISKLLFFKKCLFINIWEQCVIINFTNKVHTKGINQAFLSLFEWERIFRLQHHNNNGYLKSHSMYYSDPFMKMYRNRRRVSPIIWNGACCFHPTFLWGCDCVPKSIVLWSKILCRMGKLGLLSSTLFVLGC